MIKIPRSVVRTSEYLFRRVVGCVLSFLTYELMREAKYKRNGYNNGYKNQTSSYKSNRRI